MLFDLKEIYFLVWYSFNKILYIYLIFYTGKSMSMFFLKWLYSFADPSPPLKIL